MRADSPHGSSWTDEIAVSMQHCRLADGACSQLVRCCSLMLTSAEFRGTIFQQNGSLVFMDVRRRGGKTGSKDTQKFGIPYQEYKTGASMEWCDNEDETPRAPRAIRAP